MTPKFSSLLPMGAIGQNPVFDWQTDDVDTYIAKDENGEALGHGRETNRKRR
jgi:hypothetical protein